MKTLTLDESKARVRQLRAAGYRVKIVNLPNGDRVVLKSKRPFVCSAHHHCSKRRRR